MCRCKEIESFVSKEKFSKSDGVKSKHENMMKSNDKIPRHYGSEDEGMSFLDDSLNKNKYFAKIRNKKEIARLLNEESSSHFEVFCKTSASETYKSIHQEMFSKICFLKIQTSQNRLTKI